MKRTKGEYWALIDATGRVRGGDYRPHVYWTRRMAKEAAARFPECSIQQIIMVEAPKKKPKAKGEPA